LLFPKRKAFLPSQGRGKKGEVGSDAAIPFVRVSRNGKGSTLSTGERRGIKFAVNGLYLSDWGGGERREGREDDLTAAKMKGCSRKKSHIFHKGGENAAPS